MYTLRAGLGDASLIGNYPIGTPTFTSNDPAVPYGTTDGYNLCASAPMTPGCPGVPTATGPATTPAIYNLCAGAPMTPGCPGAPAPGSAPIIFNYTPTSTVPGALDPISNWFSQNMGTVALVGGGMLLFLVAMKAVR